jgi:hydroxyacylglutathione hydrolase
MIIDRVYTPGLAQVAYLVADERAGEVAVIDPRRDIDAYLEWANERAMRIVAILETHVHADFVSGARELAAATGAAVYAGRLGNTEFPHVPVEDGDKIRVGALVLRALWTPGHTPEHIAYLLVDPSEGEVPVALFSGDVLFAGEIGRPDLLGPEAQKQLIEQLYDTVEQRLKPLPDELTVYPGHTAGSPCGKQIGEAPQTTMGQEKTFSYAFNQPDRERFIRVVMTGMPTPPAYYPTMKRVNKVGPALLRDLPTSKPLSVLEVAAKQAAGALLIDARPVDRFARGHIPGAVSVALGPNFAIWAGWLTPYDREVVLILDEDEQYEDARTELRRVGIDAVAGYLAGGMTAWQAAGKLIEGMETIPAKDLASRLSAYTVLDVRDRTEWEDGHIPGAINAPAGDLALGAAVPVNGSGKVAVICGTGFRSALAASLLQQRGTRDVVAVNGGMSAWREAGFPAVSPEPTGAERR